ncbi:serine/threonine protein kinase [Ornithinimicrobium sp. F0845]|uniref:serine/threonine-protein kinase n=1 Tax=Ornithinimicrobium sp. F0845 TaxID=2926412 RepID=UPI001FF3B1AD|nr:serine/threonine-protein kinase [Ornithinimicrobium sp. F0845]MCK0113967.1 serine/threonine protein kinase [Ornithinimicrobium sp. F0845]
MDVPRIPGYDVLGRIGAGSSAQVWRARRVADDLDVALKVVPTRAEDVSAALREAGVLARVRHEHVIHLYDVLPVPGAGGRPGGVALAMELAAGGSLAEVLGARGHLTPGEVVTVGSPLAGALAELHRAGVVHGDIAPGNVLFREDGMPLLADLGVSRIAGEQRTDTYGTDGMVAPEVLEGFAPTAESDVYGLGALAWLCLVGETPGWAGTRTALADLRPELPEPLVALVTSCLASEPAERPDAEELAVALLAAARPEPVVLAPGADPAAGLTQRIRSERPDPDPEEQPVRSAHPRALHRAEGRVAVRSGRPSVRWLVAGAGAAVVLVLAVAGAVGALLGPDEPAGDTALSQTGAVAEAVSLVDPGDNAATTVEPSEAGRETTETSVAEPTDPGRGPARTSVADATEPRSSTAETPTAGTPAAGAVLDPVDEPQVAVQRLLDARAAAWRSGDAGDLAEALAPGSPAHEQEQESLSDAQDLKVSYRELVFTVTDASVLASGPDRAVLGVDVERSKYLEVGPAGTLQHEARADTVEVELRRAEDGWRIWGWG